jgi:hypothetical protein
MRARSLVAFFAILLGFHVAHADGRGDVEKKIKEAMEQYDLMDYDAARKLLNQALATAKKAKLDKDAVSAKAYLDLGIVAFVNNDKDAAKLSFLSAVQIDSKIQIDPAYKTADMAKLLDEARSEAGGGPAPSGGSEPAVADTTDCSSVKGLQHEIIDSAKGNTPLKIEALLGKDVTATKVSVFFRPEGATDFTEVKLAKQGDCKYTGTIPAAGMKGSLVHYYVAAYGDGNRPVAAKGSSGSPNIIEVTAGPAVATKGDDEDPINGKKDTAGGGASGGGEVSSSVTVSGPKKPKIMIAISGGTGSGYVAGTTEGNNPVKTCCFGGAIAVVMPEIGYHVSPQLAVSVAARIGIPLGANFDGHATAAPGALVRFRYALSPTGQGLHVMGQAGAGILRNTIKIDNPMMGMDTDIVAQGPLLVGGGIGLTKNLSGNIAFLAELSALAGIAVVDHMGSAPKLNNGFSADLSLGLALGF